MRKAESWGAGVSLVLLALLGTERAGMSAGADPGTWKPGRAPLMTRWGKRVRPERVHPEYPRPQMVRREWLSLNGLWQLRLAGLEAAPPLAQELERRILVPFPVESALSGVMQRVDERTRVWYRRTFDRPAGWAGSRVFLRFGAVDWETRVWVNGRQMGTHRGGYDAFGFDVTDALTPSGPQELVVGVWDPTQGGQPCGKQRRQPEGIWYTPSTGIWQTVWLEPVPAARIERLKLTPDVDAGCLRLTAATAGTRAGDLVEAVAKDGSRVAGSVRGPAGEELRLAMPEIRLWSPDDPHLYGLRVTLRRGGRALDAVDSYFGMRKIALGRDGRGVLRPMLNGRFLFHVGPLDQGFWPDGLHTAPSDGALRYDLEMTKKLGFNMTRKHIKVEPDRWYYWCDRLGLLVWQDMPSTLDHDGAGNRPFLTAEQKRQFEAELERMLEGRHNHPSIVMWVVFNEAWGQYDTERLTRWVQARDPSRLVNNASGWHDRRTGDVIDMHRYPGPGSPQPEAQRAAVLGEFGGLGLGVDGHTWAQRTWGYRQVESQARLTRDYGRLLQRVWTLKEAPGLSAAVYTQITDVESECNGLLTYDREVLKVDPQRVADANRGIFPKEERREVVLPAAPEQPQEWRYTTAAPPASWHRPDFDDRSWSAGPSGFGTRGTPGAVVRTEWNTPEIWLRRQVSLSRAQLQGLLLWLHHDEEVEVYLNGVPALRLTGYTTDYDEYDISAEARAALKAGVNTLAVHCRQTGGGQYIDVGLLRAP